MNNQLNHIIPTKGEHRCDSVAHLITRKWVAGLHRPLRHPRRRGRHRHSSARPSQPADRHRAPCPSAPTAGRPPSCATQLPESEGSAAVVLYSSDDAPHARRARRSSRSGARSPARGRPARPPVVAEDGTAATVVVPVDGQAMPTETAEVVKQTCAAAVKADLPDGPDRPRSPARPPSRPTSPPCSTGANTRLLTATASVVALLLVITYRSPVLWLVPLTVVARRRPAGRRARDPHARRLRRAVGRVDDRHPLGARLRRGHRLRAAAHLAATATSCAPPRTGATAMAHRPAAAPPRPSCRARPRSCSACSPCCSRSSRPPAASGLACAVGVVVAADVRARRAARPPLVVFGRWIFWPKVPRVGAGPAWPTASRSGAASATPSRKRPARLRHASP